MTPTENDLAEQALRLRSLGIDTRPAFAPCVGCGMPGACKVARSCATARAALDRMAEAAREQGLDYTPPVDDWRDLIRGVRVGVGDVVVITVKGGNEAARFVCGEILREKEGRA